MTCCMALVRTLLFPWLCAKFPPHRRAIEVAVKELGYDLNDEVHSVKKILKLALVRLSGEKLGSIWTRHVGRKNMHHHTLVQIACRTLNLIRPVSDTHPLCENSIDLGSTDKARFYNFETDNACLLYTSPSPRDLSTSRMPSSA